MTRVLVTGGNGGLGCLVARQLGHAGYTVRVMSRRPAPSTATAFEWAQADIETGAGLGAALAGSDVVIHAASSPFKRTRQIDVDGTQRLIEQARAAGIAHLVYISIVGIELVPFNYYRCKVAAEQLVEQSDLPWTILRATQFHSLIDLFLGQVNRLPLFVLPTDFLFQPIETGEVAHRLVELVVAGPSGRAPDIGGSEVLRMNNLAAAWLAARGQRRRIVPLPLPGAFAAAVRQGRLTTPNRRYGTITWAEWLQTAYAPPEMVTIR